MKYQEIFDVLKKSGLGISEEKKRLIREKIDSFLNYEPTVAFLGKTGVGKSSLCNALFGKEIFRVDDTRSCTRDIQDIKLSIGNKGIKLLDVPGVGESLESDKKYHRIYIDVLPEADVVLWLLKADDRAYSHDEYTYKNIIKPHIEEGKPFFIVLNQVDKIDPIREWNQKERKPSFKQKENIEKRIKYVSERFELPQSKIIPISAEEKYGLDRLVEEIIFALPNDKKITVGGKIKKEVMNEKTKETIEKAWWEKLDKILEETIPGYKEIKETIKEGVKNIINKIGKKIWDWLTR